MSLDIENLRAQDPFAEAEAEEFGGKGKKTSYVHIRIQQRNGRKSLTTIQGLPQDLDFKRLLKAFKKQFCCNGTIVDDPELGKVVQLQGDQRKSSAEFLLGEEIVKKSNLKIHGF